MLKQMQCFFVCANFECLHVNTHIQHCSRTPISTFRVNVRLSYHRNSERLIDDEAAGLT